MPDVRPGQILTAATLRDFGSPLQSYTPALHAQTTNPNLGQGATQVATWSRHGPLVIGRFHIQFGTSGVAPGSGTYMVELPVPADPQGLGRVVVGAGWIRDASDGSDSGTKLVTLHVALAQGSTSHVTMIGESIRAVNNSAPWTWAANDELMGEFSYPAVWD